MENKLAVHARSCAAKAGRRFPVLLLACAESTTPGGSAESTPAGDTTIFGTYRQVSTKEFTGRANGEEGETEIGTIITENVGGSLLAWIDEEYDDTTYLDYDPETNMVHNESAGITVHIEFALSEGGVTGSGYIRGTFWGEPIGATIELTKISDWSKEE